MPHSDAVWVTARTSADTDKTAHAFGKQCSSSQTLHTTHTRSYTCVQLLDAKVVEQSELRAYHVLHCKDRKSGRISLAVGGVNGRWSSRAIASSDYVGTDDKVLVCIQWLSGPNEPLPPPRLRVRLCAVGMARCG
jgi:hypothetical protein